MEKILSYRLFAYLSVGKRSIRSISKRRWLGVFSESIYKSILKLFSLFLLKFPILSSKNMILKMTKYTIKEFGGYLFLRMRCYILKNTKRNFVKAKEWINWFSLQICKKNVLTKFNWFMIFDWGQIPEWVNIPKSQIHERAKNPKSQNLEKSKFRNSKFKILKLWISQFRISKFRNAKSREGKIP